MRSFVQNQVNLPNDKEAKYRSQVTYLRDRFASYIALHPNLRLRKLLSSGSLAKRTQTSNLNDIDIAAYLDVGDAVPEDVDGPALVREVRAVLIQVYGNTKSPDDFVANSSAVQIHFHGSGLDVDVVPVIWDRGSDCDEGWVVRGNSTKLKTCIPRHKQFITDVHSAHPGYREFVRLLKYWRDTHELSFKSFLIELTVAHLSRSGKIDTREPLTAMQSYMDWLLSDRLTTAIFFNDWFSRSEVSGIPPIVVDPTNPRNNVADGLLDATDGATKLSRLLNAADDSLADISEALGARTETISKAAAARAFGFGITREY